jgi:hypothetical protein
LNTRCPDQVTNLCAGRRAEAAVSGSRLIRSGAPVPSPTQSVDRADAHWFLTAPLRSGGVEDRRSGEGVDGGVEDTTSRSTSTEMTRSSDTVRVRESDTERDEEDTSTEAPSGDGDAESGEPRAETGDGGDGQEARRRSQSQSQRRGAAKWVRRARRDRKLGLGLGLRAGVVSLRLPRATQTPIYPRAQCRSACGSQLGWAAGLTRGRVTRGWAAVWKLEFIAGRIRSPPNIGPCSG